MSEDLIQYAWANRLWFAQPLTTTDGQPIEVINPGRLNTDQGPDFFSAQIRIGELLWVGNVEIHTSTDEWYAHRHDSDPTYDNVVLHVVGRSTGRKVCNSAGRPIPELELRLSSRLQESAEELLRQSQTTARCADGIISLPKIIKTSWLDALAVERMEQKCLHAQNLLSSAEGDPDQLFYVLLARALGSRVNAQPMEMLAKSAPVRLVLKHRNSTLQTEALLLGQAGLLPTHGEADNDYTQALKREYAMLRAKFDLTPLEAHVWKYLRLRPTNFPEIRIVQLAAIVRTLQGNFEHTLQSIESTDELVRNLTHCSPSDYWDNHYRIGKTSERNSRKNVGKLTAQLIVINAVVPFLLNKTRRNGDHDGAEKTIDMLRKLPIEANSKIEAWSQMGLPPADECEAQALLQLTTAYCERGRCLHCRFGHQILGRRG